MGVDGIKSEAQLSKDRIIVLRFLPFLVIDVKKTPIKELNLSQIKRFKLTLMYILILYKK